MKSLIESVLKLIPVYFAKQEYFICSPINNDQLNDYLLHLSKAINYEVAL